jgi:hypothetical protein
LLSLKTHLTSWGKVEKGVSPHGRGTSERVHEGGQGREEKEEPLRPKKATVPLEPGPPLPDLPPGLLPRPGQLIRWSIFSSTSAMNRQERNDVKKKSEGGEGLGDWQEFRLVDSEMRKTGRRREGGGWEEEKGVRGGE